MMAQFINVPQEIGIFAEDGGRVGRGCSWFKSLVIGYPKALDRECVMVNGAAVSALGKIMQFHRERLNVAKTFLFGLIFWFLYLAGYRDVVKPFATKNNRNQATVLHHRLIPTIKVNTAKNSPFCYHFSISMVNTAKKSLMNKHNKLQSIIC
ncbi:hypothetical protein NC651_008333 [Populus alba x Populus x berolinensis]|nr:hypothetical protein NC651_008333 [Populus alba x Populus x berolinensis]